MGVFRVKKEANYTTMCNYHFKEKDLSLKAKGLLSWMLSLPDDWDYSIRGIAKCHKDGEDAVTSALKELQKFGYLEIIKLIPGTIIEKSDGSKELLNHIDYDYVIHEKPIISQDTDFQCLENQATENQSQINTKEENTKIPKGTVDGAHSKNHHNIYKKKEKLIDDLESGKDISEQKKEKKKLSEIEKAEKIIDKTNYSDNVKELLNKFFRQSYYSDSVRRMKNANDLKDRLKKLDDLVSKGEDAMQVVQYCIDNCYNSFWKPNTSVTSKRGGETLENSIVTTDVKEAQRIWDEAIQSGKGEYC